MRPVPLSCACLTIFKVKGPRAGGDLLQGKDVVMGFLSRFRVEAKSFEFTLEEGVSVL